MTPAFARRILFASANQGKIHEVKSAAAALGITVIGADELTAGFGPAPEVTEDGASYLENARLKAGSYLRWSGECALADDSGLEVAALGGAPGLHTARFAGQGCSAADNRAKLLSVLSGTADRRARFVCVLCLLFPDGTELSVEAALTGTISTSQRGTGGFGYDPVFEVDGYGGRTLAELKQQGVPVETHRILALGKLAGCLAAVPRK